MNARQRRKARRAAERYGLAEGDVQRRYEASLIAISAKLSPAPGAWIDWVPVDAELAAIGPRADLPDDPDTPPGLPPRLPDGPVPLPPGDTPQAPPCCPPDDEADEDHDDEDHDDEDHDDAAERAAAVASLIRGTGLAVEDQLELFDAIFIKGASLADVADRAANLQSRRS